MPRPRCCPINGSREALFAFAQTVIDGRADALVVLPNLLQIYEGAALLAGATPYYVEQAAANGFRCDWRAVPDAVWQRTQLLYVCSPANPTGAVMPLEEWRLLFELSDRFGFSITSDECYSEIYFDESSPPLGALQAAQALGRADYRRVVAFTSLSKRSNVPGMRSGFVAGDADLIRPFLLYRTYHGSAISLTVSAASVAAWGDEAHVQDNRSQYRAKFDALEPLLAGVLETSRPQAGFYFWAGVPGGDDAAFVRELYRQYNVLALPGSYLARETGGRNPGRGLIRLALVEPLAQCVEGVGTPQSFRSISTSRAPASSALVVAAMRLPSAEIAAENSVAGTELAGSSMMPSPLTAPAASVTPTSARVSSFVLVEHDGGVAAVAADLDDPIVLQHHQVAAAILGGRPRLALALHHRPARGSPGRIERPGAGQPVADQVRRERRLVAQRGCPRRCRHRGGVAVAGGHDGAGALAPNSVGLGDTAVDEHRVQHRNAGLRGAQPDTGDAGIRYAARRQVQHDDVVAQTRAEIRIPGADDLAIGRHRPVAAVVSQASGLSQVNALPPLNVGSAAPVLARTRAT